MHAHTLQADIQAATLASAAMGIAHVVGTMVAVPILEFADRKPLLANSYVCQVWEVWTSVGEVGAMFAVLMLELADRKPLLANSYVCQVQGV